MKQLLLACLVLAACSKSSSSPPPPPPPAPAPEPQIDQLDDLKFVGEPIKQAADFPRDRWVRTEVFGSKAPYIGFTYVDASKGNCIKGEDITGLSEAEIKDKLHAKFPSSSLEPIPEGHPMTLLTPEEIKQYDLPAKPDWVSYYEP